MMLVFILPVILSGAIIIFLIKRDYENMGGKWPAFYTPFNVRKLHEEYITFCKKNDKKPILIYLLLLPLALFAILIILSILSER